jgi:hypothetical protein
MNVLDFDEFLECVARCGVDKYKGVKAMTPADGIKGLMQNMLGEAEEEEVVVRATYIKADRWDLENGNRMATAIDGDTMVLEDVEPAKALPSDKAGDFEKWLECWKRIEIMDMHMWPLWEKTVHDILQPLFKELQLIFLAYTRSISETSAEDAMEMDMGEFHDFVVDVGLETKTYTFDVMCNQFIKANATNTAQVREQRMAARKNASSKDDLEEQNAAKAKVPEKIKGKSDGTEAKKDAELVLYEFIGMLVRISFWRCNPSFGNFVDKDGDGKKDAEEFLPVPACLSKVLNEVILPHAKRETSGAFRDKQMKDPDMLKVLQEEYKDKLERWYKDVTSNDSKANVITDKITFEDWLRVLNAQDLVGVWEAEQMSEITGDPSTKGNIKCRLSIPQAKAAFLDSQKLTELGVGQSDADDASNVLDYEEFLECVARAGTAKYSAVKAFTWAHAVRAFCQNMMGERDEVTILREDTYIRAERFDFKTESKPMPGMSSEAHAAFLADWEQLCDKLNGVCGFPTWEKEVHDILMAHHAELKSIFGAYCKTLGVTDATASTMDMEEFKDFVLDVRLETKTAYKDTSYTWEQMGAAFAKANESGKGLAGPPADAQLVFYEFLNVLTRVSFCTMNPAFGEMLAGDGSTQDYWPAPGALKEVLEKRVLPDAHRDDAPAFRKDVLTTPEVQAVLTEYRGRLEDWWKAIPFDAAISDSKLGIVQWEAMLKKLNVVGTFTCEQGSDVVGDPMVGTVHTIRLSVPQAKAAFANAQTAAADGSVDSITCEFDEMLECLARCGVDKYKLVKQISKANAVKGFVENILGDADEDAVITRHTYNFCPRFDASAESKPAPSMSADEHAEFLGLWTGIANEKINNIYGFPTWEKEVHAAVLGAYSELKSIFRAYSAGSLDGSATEMDMEEFHDFVIECDIPTKEYAFDTMVLQYQNANQGSGDRVLELNEFVAMVVRIAFFRANPQSGMINVKKGEGHEKMGADMSMGELQPLPGCLVKLLAEKIMPNARRDNAAEFKTKELVASDVAQVLDVERQRLLDWWEMVSGGKDTISMEMWLAELEKGLLFNDLSITDISNQEHRCRFSVPQAKAAFCAGCSLPASGMMLEEILEVVARCGVAKYKGVKAMALGQAVNAFIRNLLGEADEEMCVFEVTGGAPERAEVPKRPKPKPSPPKPKPKPAAAPAPPPAAPAPPAAPPAEPAAPTAPPAAAAAAPPDVSDAAPPADAAAAGAPEPASPAKKKKLKGAGNPKTKGIPGINPPPPEPDSSEDEDEEGEGEVLE